jgi:Zn-dependent protease
MSEQPTSTLPPEVEAELRRRAAAARETDAPGEAPAAPASPHPGPREERSSGSGWLGRLGSAGVLLAVLSGKLKLLLPLAKFGLPILKTGGTMLLSVALYAQQGGWPFAVGFVLSIFVHEMGHVFAMWRLGMPVSAPLFIPFMGAIIFQQRSNHSPWQGALVGIAGPVAGTLGALACLGAYHATGLPLLLHLAYVGFMLNLFNLAPLFPMDGGWITGAISPRIWLLGIVGMGALFFTGTVRNPLLLLLVLLSLPRLWKGLRTGDITPEGGVPATTRQRVVMGVAYVSLSALLLWLMLETHVAA